MKISEAPRPRSPSHTNTSCPPSPVFENLFGNGLTFVAATWRNRRTVGMLINCLEPPVPVSAHVHHITQIHKYFLVETFSVCRDTRWPVAARSTRPFRRWNTAHVSLPFGPRELPSPCSEARHIVIGGMSKSHVKTSQGCLDSRCQSLTVAWVQLGVVEGDSRWGRSGF